jgi:DNA polymerase-1
MSFVRKIITTNQELREAVAYLRGLNIVGVDTETYDRRGRPMAAMGALSPHENAIRLVQLAGGGRSYVVDLHQATDIEPLVALMMDPEVIKVGQNLKFETGNFLKHWGCWVENCFDTMIASRFFQVFTKRFPETGEYPPSYSTDERRHNLAIICQRFLGLDISKAEQASDWSGELTEEQIDYAFLDAEVMIPLYEILSEKIKAAGLENAAWIEFRAIPASAEMELAGWSVDEPHFHRLSTEIRARVEERRRFLSTKFPAKQRSLFGDNGINFDSPKQLAKAIADRYHVMTDSTDRRALLALRCDEELARRFPDLVETVDTLVDYSSLMTLMGQIDAVLSNVSPTTRRVHPDIIQLGQDQHRTATRKPNTSQVPRPDTYGHKSRWDAFRSEINFREGFVPAPGYKFAICDFASNQLRIIADQSNDRRMVEEFNRKDADIYTATASAILGRPREEVSKGTPERQNAKVWVLSFSFAVGAGTYQKQKLEDTREYTSLDQCRREREAFFEIYPGLRRWHHRMVEDVKGRHMIETPIGRKIFFHPDCAKAGLIYTEAINFPVCATEVDGARLAIGRLFRAIKKHGYDARIVGFIYDEIVIEVAERDAQAVSILQHEIMRDSMQRMLKRVPAAVEGGIGANWAAK